MKYLVIGLLILGSSMIFYSWAREPRDVNDAFVLALIDFSGRIVIRIDGALVVLWALWRFWRA